ncbi:adhesion G-protein coupled receptor G5-like [Xyrichtys novacula]|uniref:Adhesion G-protein coupled receptor G5-like n=1 Tax=Xyrichtys novacula TaxID=13765 RepID=A0AAV1GYA1_XYRNO|nr:adhesion G-protein coupled receptor G5-like [Xyrichtys novacula]
MEKNLNNLDVDFNCTINVQPYWKHNKSMMWLYKEPKDNVFLLYTRRRFIWKGHSLVVLQGKQCENMTSRFRNGSCHVTPSHIKELCDPIPFEEIPYNKTDPPVKDTNKTSEELKEKLDSDDLRQLGVTLKSEEGEDLDPCQAHIVMGKMGNVATFINTSSAVLDLGEGVSGILVKEKDPANPHEVSFGYVSPNDSINVIENKATLAQYSRSITVTKEAFEKAISLNVSVPFAAIVKFMNMAKDERNSTVLGNEVLAVEMGTIIRNLTDRIEINVWNAVYEGIPSCQSWNGQGRLSWTDDGCVTIKNGSNITCQCSHLTFFAVLLTPLNETITSSDLNNLTIITQVGCSLSLLFLAVLLFMHFLVRRIKASTSTGLLIHLVLAIFPLNFTFLINNYVAKLKSSVGCAIMGAVMHYFMLATFTWFAVQAFHLCLQLYSGGKIVIRHYLLKVCIISWALPSVPAIILLATGKYGELVIYTNDPNQNVLMCWITDNNVHYIVNIGYYAVVFLFTISTFVIVLTWLYYLKRTEAGHAKYDKSGMRISTILGLCCMLGITWGFAFFAYGTLLIPSYYIFTVLNSLQGFFLFIYYYNSRHAEDFSTAQTNCYSVSTSTSTSTSTVSNVNTHNSCENPYINMPTKTSHLE